MPIRGSLVARCLIIAGSVTVLAAAQRVRQDDTLATVRAQLQLRAASLATPDIVTTGEDRLEVGVSIDGVRRVLELELNSLRSPDFKAYAQYEVGGPLVEVEPPPVSTYVGSVRDLPDSRVRATVRDGRVTARITMNGELFGVQPLDELNIEAKRGVHAVYRQSDWIDAGLQCGVDHAAIPNEPSDIQPGGERQASGGEILVTEIAFDADHDFYEDNNDSVPQSISQIESFMNGVSGVYEEPDVGITYLVGVIIVRTVPGTYSTTSPSGLLSEFQEVWTSPPENTIHRDIAHLYTGKNLNGSVIGIAQISVICNFTGVGLSENFTGNYNSMVALTAHELGHNWSAQHCNAAPDCRIMCSGLGGCDGLNPLTFAPVPVNQIVNKRDASSCLTPLVPATTLPFCEDWAVPGFEPSRWSYTSGATLTALGSLNPSEPFALQLNAASDGPYADDEIRSNHIDLAGESGVVFSYHTQHSGVEIDEELIIDYWSNNDEWVEINTIVSDGIDQYIYRYHEHVLPGNAYHDEFRIRFRADVNAFSDYWRVDDISLDCFAAPVCSAPCDDGQVCTTNEGCVDNLCTGTAIDCSRQGDQCNTAACDQSGTAANCDLLTPVEDGTVCNGGSGFCQGGQCVDPASTARIFMAPDGAENSATGLGATAMTVAQGSTTRVMVWLADNGASGDQLNAYQVILPMEATPLGGATGTLTYLDANAGDPGGDSIVIDTTRDDWIFADEVAVLEAVYSEAPAIGLFGVFYSTIQGLGVDPSPGKAAHYLLEFDIVASAGALGDFELGFNQGPDGSPPLTSLFTPVGGEFITEQFQPLIITVAESVNDCMAIADCADVDGNEVRDDNCIWWACTAGTCTGTDVVFGDMGGQFGACPPDGTADGNDRFHALNCFADTGSDGGDYECEDDPPAAFNVDAGGQFGSCDPDGVCDGNDAFAARNAFGGVTTCSCPLGGPAPTAPSAAMIMGEAHIRLESDRKRVRPGELVHVDVLLDGRLDDLRGYQLHLTADGGARGTLELVDIALHQPTVLGHGSSAQRAADAGQWSAYNVHTGQLVVGRDQPGTPVEAGYLATFVFQASRKAAGVFTVDLRHDPDSADDRTFLFPTLPTGRITVTSTPAVAIEVAGRAR